MKLPGVRSKLILLSAIVVAMVITVLFLMLRWGLWLHTIIIYLVLSAGAVYIFGVKEKYPRIRVAAAVLGVLGGVVTIFGLLSTFRFFPYPFPQGVSGTIACLMAIGGGVLALERPRVGGLLMLLGVIAGWSIMFNWHASFFLLPGIILALAPDKKRPAAIYAAMIIGIIGGLFATLCPIMEGLLFLRGKEVIAFWIWVLLFPAMGLLGGILVLGKPKLAGILMLISGIIGPVGFIGLRRWDWYLDLAICALAGLLLIIAGTMACIKERPAAVAAVGGAIFLLFFFFLYLIRGYLIRGFSYLLT